MQNTKQRALPPFDASRYRVGIVAAQFNNDITAKILASAKNKLSEYGVTDKNTNVIQVPGCVEIPAVLQAMARAKRYDCLIAIGAIIRGKTDHYEYVANIAAESVLRVIMDYRLPVGFAILTTPNKKLAEERVDIGAEAVTAALHSVKIIKKLCVIHPKKY